MLVCFVCVRGDKLKEQDVRLKLSALNKRVVTQFCLFSVSV